MRDRFGLALMLLTAPLVGTLTTVVAKRRMFSADEGDFADAITALFLMLSVWAGRGRAPLTRRDWMVVIGLGFSGYYLASTLDFMGLKYISASLERLILYLNPTLVLLLGVLLFTFVLFLQRLGSAGRLAESSIGAGDAALHGFRQCAGKSNLHPGHRSGGRDALPAQRGCESRQPGSSTGCGRHVHPARYRSGPVDRGPFRASHLLLLRSGFAR